MNLIAELDQIDVSSSRLRKILPPASRTDSGRPGRFDAHGHTGDLFIFAIITSGLCDNNRSVDAVTNEYHSGRARKQILAPGFGQANHAAATRTAQVVREA